LQFGVDFLLVAYGIDAPVHMSHITVIEAAEHMDDGICLTDIGEELVAETFAFAGSSDKSGDVDNLHRCRYYPARMNYLSQFCEPFVGDGDDSYVRLDSTEGEVGGLSFGVRQAIEKCGFTHVGESDNSAL
jgi:hypothetical protein